ncbi:MAG: hypothetical protein ABW321_35850 [Polyangiales bacterium]
MNTRQRSVVGLASLAVTVLATGCLDRELKPLNPCLVSGVSREVLADNVDKVDLLFMVDNSNSMAGEQESLRQQFPNVINVLTTGFRFPGDTEPFPPVKDLHVGIVSSDMGIPGVNYPPCLADGGDDGKLQHTPRGAMCNAADPVFAAPFLSFVSGGMAVDESITRKFADDVACIATLGTGGCGFEQQLEAPFKALWPSVYQDQNGEVVSPNPFYFLSTSMMGTLGRGDIPIAQGGNQGFLRNEVGAISLIAIVIVTDEEDCSVEQTEHLRPTNQLMDGSPYREQDINLRCYYNPQFLYDLQLRYYNGFRMLRPGKENLVVFAAITGVPPDLVDKDALAFDFQDANLRNSFYDTILGDPAMQYTTDAQTGGGQGNLLPSCVRTVAGDPMPSTAYPPRRIVELAKLFGEQGIVQSICQDDFGPAMEAIINIIANQLNEVCLPRPLVRQSTGKVACNVVWELPPTSPNPATPTSCSAYPFLAPVTGGRAPTNAKGGQNCEVTQLPVDGTSTSAGTPPPGQGWFYDDFTEDLAKTCKDTELQRVAFTADAKPPTGVTVKLECLNETQKYASTRTDLAANQPEIGTNCGSMMEGAVQGDQACIVTNNRGEQDRRMFCHPELNTCVLSCTSTTDCPPAWVCDDRPNTLTATAGKGAYCVNPTCGADTENN